jgi:hypothetical protein
MGEEFISGLFFLQRKHPYMKPLIYKAVIKPIWSYGMEL